MEPKTDNGYVTTGLIDVSAMSGEVEIRTKGVDFSNSQSAFCTYLADGSSYGRMYISDAVSSKFATLDSDGNLTMTINTATMAKYCRFIPFLRYSGSYIRVLFR